MKRGRWVKGYMYSKSYIMARRELRDITRDLIIFPEGGNSKYNSHSYTCSMSSLSQFSHTVCVN